jgi:hypothetical protein
MNDRVSWTEDRRRELAARLVSGVEVSDATGCWVWQGAKTRGGYGKLTFHGRQLRASRAMGMLALCGMPSWEAPTRLQVCHHCDNPPCINPDHLFIGRPRDNMQDARSKGHLQDLPGSSAANAAKTHCPQGHALVGENLYQPPGRRHRQCRTCSAEASRRYRATKATRDAACGPL